MPNIALAFSDREMAALESVAEQLGKTINEVIRAAIKAHIGQERDRQLASAKPSPVLKDQQDPDIDEALSLIDDIQAMADDVPERGADFAESVRDKAASIGESIERDGRVTANQIHALENMRDGLERWLR